MNEGGIDSIRGHFMDKNAKIPEHYQDIYNTVTGLTDAFCDAHLNNEYKQLCRKMALDLCQHRFPLMKGKPEGWACGIVYVVGWANFLNDPSQTPHMRSEDIAKGFRVSPATMMAKAKMIREGLNLMAMHPDWTLASRMERNPLVWMLKVNGVLMDIRDAPREAQEEAFRQGLIPYIPADRKK